MYKTPVYTLLDVLHVELAYTQLLLLLLPRYWRCARFDIVREIAGIRCCVTGALMMKTTPIDVPWRHIIHSRKLFVWGAVVVEH